MKKLRLKDEEWKDLLNDISEKFNKDCKRNISEFDYTKTDVTAFLKKITDEKINKPIIKITTEAYVKMYELVKQSSVEIQWHGMVQKYPDDTYLIYDILVFPQSNTATSTNTDQNEFAEWQMKLIMDENFPIQQMRMHGHSHVNMNVYSSAIDDGYQTDLITKVEDGDYYIFLVLNKKMEMYALLYDFDKQIIFENNDIEVEIMDQAGGNIKEWCAKQIKDNCKTGYIKTWQTPYANQSPATNFTLEEEIGSYIHGITQSPRRIRR